MRGPFWNNGRTGVTGEAPGFVTNEPDYETYTDEDGRTRTRVGVEKNTTKENE